MDVWWLSGFVHTRGGGGGGPGKRKVLVESNVRNGLMSVKRHRTFRAGLSVDEREIIKQGEKEMGLSILLAALIIPWRDRGVPFSNSS